MSVNVPNPLGATPMTPIGVRLQHYLPHGLLARAVYRISRSARSWIKRPLIRWFAAHYAVDLSEADCTNIEDFATFNAFFTRALKPGSRPIDRAPTSLVAPVDGTLTEFGEMHAGTLIQAKGLDYTAEALLGKGPVAVDAQTRGAYATIYLAPHNYHRVHLPLAGRLLATRYIPGKRYSVNGATARGIRDLFCRNERAVCWFETTAGPMAVVLVGALNVSSISLAGHGEIASGTERYWVEEVPPPFAKGAEIGRFNLGSTVILVFPQNDRVAWRRDRSRGDVVQMGEAIGSVVPAAEL